MPKNIRTHLRDPSPRTSRSETPRVKGQEKTRLLPWPRVVFRHRTGESTTVFRFLEISDPIVINKKKKNNCVISQTTGTSPLQEVENHQPFSRPWHTIWSGRYGNFCAEEVELWQNPFKFYSAVFLEMTACKRKNEYCNCFWEAGLKCFHRNDDPSFSTSQKRVASLRGNIYVVSHRNPMKVSSGSKCV